MSSEAQPSSTAENSRFSTMAVMAIHHLLLYACDKLGAMTAGDTGKTWVWFPVSPAQCPQTQHWTFSDHCLNQLLWPNKSLTQSLYVIDYKWASYLLGGLCLFYVSLSVSDTTQEHICYIYMNLNLWSSCNALCWTWFMQSYKSSFAWITAERETPSATWRDIALCLVKSCRVTFLNREESWLWVSH